MRKRAFKSRNSGQSGQAIIEYILILVVTVSIIFGMIYQFNQAFRAWADAYFGEYVVCLLETAELPDAGGPGSAQCERPTFQAKIQAPESSSGPGGGGSDSDSGSRSEDAAASRNGNAETAGSESSGSGRGSRGMGSRFRVKRASSVGAGGEGEGEESGGSSLAGGVGSSSYYNSNDLRPKRIPVSYDYRRHSKAQEVKPIAKKTKSSKVEQGSERTGAPILIKIQARKPSEAKEVNLGGWNFGHYFRYFIILIIIIMIVIFVGGQILQVSKSMD